MKRFYIWLCGKIDPRYDEALYGVYHLEAEDWRGKTLCGIRTGHRHTKTSFWDCDERSTTDAESASCNRCRKAAGLEPIRESLVML